MLSPHPCLRPLDLRPAAAEPGLPELLANADVHRFYNARAAIYHLAHALRGRGRSTLLLPAFHCPSVVEPVLRAGMRPAFYRVDRNLELDATDIVGRLNGDVAAVLFINYLGFPSGFEPLLDELRAREILAIEDCAHASVEIDPLELAGRRGDAAIYSFWKLVPSGVGGGLWLSRNVELTLPPLARVPLRDSMVRGKRLVEELIAGLGEESVLARTYGWLEHSRVKAKSLFATRMGPPVGSIGPRVDSGVPQEGELREYFFDQRLAGSRLPWLAEQIMARADLQSIVSARRRNYCVLKESLNPDTPIEIMRPDLPDRISPLAFPVAMADRSAHDVVLRAKGVPVWTFGSTLHRIMLETADPAITADARHLANTMLLIPVHHMLGETDMKSLAGIVNRYATENMACASS